MPTIMYKCEKCGADFQSGRVRKGLKVCGTCAAALRKEGKGVIQANGKEKTPKAPKAEAPKVEPKKEEPKVETPKADVPPVAIQAEVKKEKAPKADAKKDEKAPEAPKAGGSGSLQEMAAEIKAKYAKKEGKDKPGEKI